MTPPDPGGPCRTPALRASRRLAGVAVVLGLTIAAISSTGSAAAPGATAPGGPVVSPVTRTGAYLTDDEGRVVIFHGVNIIRKTAPYWPSTITKTDARLLANEGFNSARIGWIWSAAEPSPGTYDEAYLPKLMRLNTLLGRYGIRTLVDVHQDSYSAKDGGDGAPRWATPSTTSAISWKAFWNNRKASDGVGIQSRFVQLWGELARVIDGSARAANVIGIDPLNEPNPGIHYPNCGLDPCPAFESGPLARFYRKVIASVRAAGATQVIWPESGPQHLGYKPALPPFSDPQTAYSWHYYCLQSELSATSSASIEHTCDPLTRKAMAHESAYGARLGVPEWVGEFGANGANAEYAKQVDAMGAHFLDWTYWDYDNPPKDPSDFPAGGILKHANAPGSQANANQAKLTALVVPYPQAIAGTPTSYAYHRTSDVMALRYRTEAVPGATLTPGALTQIFVPRRHYPHGYRVTVSGATVVSGVHSPWLLLLANSGASKVSVTVSPRAHSHTLLPSQTGRVPVPTA
ncbi:MAG TPA: cellulase family glycosylhydrolase [Mycobacteriales bacterium]|nr:cellulase family glycosylhydrolase [Mycobacteriales bacterium]